MSSHLACIGMAVTSPDELDAVVAEIVQAGKMPVVAPGEDDGVPTYAWQDPSGARVVYDLVDGEPLILPGYGDATIVRYAGIQAQAPEVARLSIIGPDGATETGVTAELEQRRHLGSLPTEGRVALCAMGVHVATFPDEASFLHSDASLLGTVEEFGEPPPEVLEQGLAWPPRMSTRAFFANGYFDGSAEPTPHALISAVVRERRDLVNEFTGQAFVVALVDAPFGSLPVCLAAVEHPDLRPGQVLTGTVSVVGSVLPGDPCAPASEDAAQPADTGEGDPSGTNDAPAPGSVPAEPTQAPIDETPLPGETRREWRRRTGRE